MGFYFEEGFEIQDLIHDIDAQIEFHKNNLLTSDVILVEEVVKKFMVAILGSMDAEQAEGSLPLLTAIGESLFQLRNEADILRQELLEKKMPPPNEFGLN
tara:strand:- start:2157 stop:2456 length:300 start_codon:yes stop_codon:yes gene_type:complete